MEDYGENTICGKKAILEVNFLFQAWINAGRALLQAGYGFASQSLRPQRDDTTDSEAGSAGDH